MTEINPNQIIWYQGDDYAPRDGAYAQKLADISLVEATALIAKRAEEDGEWAIANGVVGGNEEKMRHMMAWVSNGTNIGQIVGDILRKQEEGERTVDSVCRELAEITKVIGSGVMRG